MRLMSWKWAAHSTGQLLLHCCWQLGPPDASRPSESDMSLPLAWQLESLLYSRSP